MQILSVRAGENLARVLKTAGYSVDAQCGGQGTCGRCAVRILKGRVAVSGTGVLPQKKREAGYVLSCLASVLTDLEIEFDFDLSSKTFGQEDNPFNPDVELLPLTVKSCIETGGFSRVQGRCDVDYLGPAAARMPLQELARVPSCLRHPSGRITLTRLEGENFFPVLKIEPGDTVKSHFGLACDIGTTTIAVRLVNLYSGLVVDTRSAYNRQTQNGADVISRIIYAQKAGHLRALQDQAVGTVNDLIKSILKKHDISTGNITAVYCAGNTTMTHLILGIDPRYIREAPYVPAVKEVPVLRARELGLNVFPEAALFFAPCVGSYVGGDITAGLLCAQGEKENGVFLFIDIGTNGELVISGPDWKIGCACSAGPAFEGVGIRNGMRAAEGAINAVTVKGENVVCSVLGDKAPRGICGSGLIELVAELFTAGIIGRDGKFNPHPRVRKIDGITAFVLAEGEQTANHQAITVTEHDIANILRAKAAIFSAMRLLLKNLGLTFKDIARIDIAGGFGCRLNIQKAVSIGLFPNLARRKFHYLGNTSLNGATLALMSQKHHEKMQSIARSMTYIDLSSEPDYMDEYTGALFLPHTDEAVINDQ